MHSGAALAGIQPICRRRAAKIRFNEPYRPTVLRSLIIFCVKLAKRFSASPMLRAVI
jgi:hypothetical protein